MRNTRSAISPRLATSSVVVIIGWMLRAALGSIACAATPRSRRSPATTTKSSSARATCVAPPPGRTGLAPTAAAFDPFFRRKAVRHFREEQERVFPLLLAHVDEPPPELLRALLEHGRLPEALEPLTRHCRERSRLRRALLEERTQALLPLGGGAAACSDPRQLRRVGLLADEALRSAHRCRPAGEERHDYALDGRVEVVGDLVDEADVSASPRRSARRS